jgi:hypothetical protein
MKYLIFFIIWIFGIFETYSLTRRLKTSHATAWSELGKPGFGGSISSSLNLLRFLLTGRFRQLGDPALTSAGTMVICALGGCLIVGLTIVWHFLHLKGSVP